MAPGFIEFTHRSTPIDKGTDGRDTAYLLGLASPCSMMCSLCSLPCPINYNMLTAIDRHFKIFDPLYNYSIANMFWLTCPRIHRSASAMVRFNYIAYLNLQLYSLNVQRVTYGIRRRNSGSQCRNCYRARDENISYHQQPCSADCGFTYCWNSVIVNQCSCNGSWELPPVVHWQYPSIFRPFASSSYDNCNTCSEAVTVEQDDTDSCSRFQQYKIK